MTLNNVIKSNIVVGDLAGVENRFTCKPTRIVILDNIYIKIYL